jgi:hypothetical protein
MMTHQHRLHSVTVPQAQEIFDGAVGALLPAMDRKGIYVKLLVQPAAKRQRQVLHLLKAQGSLPVQPAENLRGPVTGLAHGRQRLFKALWRQGFDIRFRRFHAALLLLPSSVRDPGSAAASGQPGDVKTVPARLFWQDRPPGKVVCPSQSNSGCDSSRRRTTAPFSCGFRVQVAYTSAPPLLRYCAEVSRILY